MAERSTTVSITCPHGCALRADPDAMPVCVRHGLMAVRWNQESCRITWAPSRVYAQAVQVVSDDATDDRLDAMQCITAWASNGLKTAQGPTP